jgi:hypothetical protein
MMVRERESAPRTGYCLSEDEDKLLPTGFLSERPQQRLLILRDEIEELTTDQPGEIRDFFFLALAHVVANGAGNFAFGPEIYRTKAKTDYDVLKHFGQHTSLMISEMEHAKINGNDKVAAQVFLDDARRLDHIPSGLAGVITSPPYPNEKDYTRTTRVESLLLRLVKNREQLRFIKESLLRSNTRNGERLGVGPELLTYSSRRFDCTCDGGPKPFANRTSSNFETTRKGRWGLAFKS